MSPVLPLEICDFIIDILAADHPGFTRSVYSSRSNDLRCQATLRACSITCRAWVPRARKHLYPHVLLPQHKISVLSESLALCPSNGAAVQHLHIFHEGNKSDEPDLSLLPQLLPLQLPNLTHVTFERIDFSPLEESVFFKQLSLFKSVKLLRCYDTICTSVRQFAHLVQAFAPLDHFEAGGCKFKSNHTDLQPLGATYSNNTTWIRRLSVASLCFNPHGPGTSSLFRIFSPVHLLSLKLVLRNSTARSITCTRLARNLQFLVLHFNDERGGVWTFNPCK